MAVELNTFVTGKQDPVALRTRTTDPEVTGDAGLVYQKDIGGGVRELFYKDPDTGDDIVQITDGDGLNESGGAVVFTGHTDTPSTYVGSENFLVRVNAVPDALEFVTPAGIDTLAWHDGGDAGYTGVLGTTDAVDLSFHTADVERLRIQSGAGFAVEMIAPAGINQTLRWYRTTTQHAQLGLEASAEQNVPDSTINDIVLRLSASSRTFWITTDGFSATARFSAGSTKLRGAGNLLVLAPRGLNDASNILFQSRTETNKFQFGWGSAGSLVTGGAAEPGYSAIVNLVDIPFYFSLDGTQNRNWLTRVVSTIPRIGTDLVKEFQIETNGTVRHHFSATGEVGNGLTNPGVTSGTNGVGALYHLANVTTPPTGTPTGGGAILYATAAELHVLGALGPSDGVILENGSASTPSLRLRNSLGSGMYRFGANTIGFATNGTMALQITSTQRLNGVDGTAGQPTYSYRTTNTMGMFKIASGRLGFSTASTLRLEINATGVVIVAGELEVDGDLNHDGSNIGFFGKAPVAQAAAYTRNAAVVEDRTLLASASATTINNNNVLAALIADLQGYGLLQ